ncbi:MAG: hypothetical protein ACE5MK_10500, partial [Acidobacteriota bacterium]
RGSLLVVETKPHRDALSGVIIPDCDVGADALRAAFGVRSENGRYRFQPWGTCVLRLQLVANKKKRAIEDILTSELG